MTTKPNLFIVGAPKCGTTSMHAYLRQHPQVFVPSCKEPHYFATDFDERGYIRDRGSYYQLFDSARHTTYIAEASVWYLYSLQAARRIHEELGNVKIIAMFRNPVDLLYSLHSQSLVSGQENIRDFTHALNAEADRRAGYRWPRGRHDRKLLYSDIIDFAGQLERYVKIFGWDAIHVILFDDLRKNTAAVFRSCAEFLGIDTDAHIQFDVVNPNKKVRSPGVQRWIRNPSPVIRQFARVCLPDTIRRFILRRLTRANVYEQPRPSLDPALRAALSARFRPQVRRLEALIGRDLSSWYRLPASADERSN